MARCVSVCVCVCLCHQSSMACVACIPEMRNICLAIATSIYLQTHTHIYICVRIVRLENAAAGIWKSCYALGSSSRLPSFAVARITISFHLFRFSAWQRAAKGPTKNLFSSFLYSWLWYGVVWCGVVWGSWSVVQGFAGVFWLLPSKTNANRIETQIEM